jgi:hypothetical protein
MKKYDPFGKALEEAIADFDKHLGNTTANLELNRTIAGMIEAQADGPCRDYYNSIDTKFGRIQNPKERVAFLEEQQRTIRDSPEVIFYDSELLHIEPGLDQRERLARVIGIMVTPVPDLFIFWEDCCGSSAKFIQGVPFLKRLLEGFIAAQNLDFLEKELGLRQSKFTPEQVIRLLKMEYLNKQGEPVHFIHDDISQMELFSFTYDDWVNGNDKMDLFLESDSFSPRQCLDAGEITWKVYTLPPLQFQKIQNKKNDILEGLILSYTNVLTGNFESKFSQTNEKKRLTESELERLEKLLFDENSTDIYRIYDEKLMVSFRNDQRSSETIFHWYKRICIDMEDPKQAIGPYHIDIKATGLRDSENIKYVVAAIAFGCDPAVM